MYEKVLDVPLPHGTISPWASNLSICWLDTKTTTFMAVIQSNNIYLGMWENKDEPDVIWETFTNSDQVTNEKIVDVTTVGLVHPNARTSPLVIVGSTRYVTFYDAKKHSNSSQPPKPLFSINLTQALKDGKMSVGNGVGPYCRGISCNDNTILIGTYTGEILVVTCNGENNFTNKKNMKEHKNAVADISTCRYDEITVSADSEGEIIIWQKPVKGVNIRVQSEQNINVINVLRKQIIVGTLRGLVQYYSVTTGDLMCEINAHMRPVNSISVAPESAYVLTSSEDGTFIVSKLHTRKPHAYQVEFRYSDCETANSIVGAQFTNGRGSAIAVAAYDQSVISMYRIVKKAQS